MLYSVFLLDETMPVPTADLGKPMQKVLGGIAYDHMNSINHSHGWIARKLERDQAELLGAEIKAVGHETIE